MNTLPAFNFQWLSPLGVSVILFLGHGSACVMDNPGDCGLWPPLI
jgi:hypothetical protein